MRPLDQLYADQIRERAIQGLRSTVTATITGAALVIIILSANLRGIVPHAVWGQVPGWLLMVWGTARAHRDLVKARRAMLESLARLDDAMRDLDRTASSQLTFGYWQERR